MKEKIKKIYNWEYFPFLLVFVILLFGSFFIDIFGYADDSWFIEWSENRSSIDFLTWRYGDWTSRVIIEFFLINLLKMGKIICSIFVSLMFSLLGVAISKTFILNKNDIEKNRIINWIILFLLLTISYDVLIGAGVMATIVNYLFPITLGIFALLFIRKSILKEKIRKYEYPLYLFSVIVATNMEQMCAILFVVSFLALIYFIVKEKKLNIFILILFIISTVGLVNILVCPGNDLRYESEIKTWYPDYANFGIIEKIKCGIYAVMVSCFGSVNLPYIIFSIIIMIQILKNYKNIILKIISIIPVILGTAFTLFAPITSTIFPNMYGINNVIMTGFNAQTTRLLFFIPYIFALLCLVISTLLVYRKNWKTILLLLISLTRFTSKFIMGFNPIVFISGGRAFFIMICTFIISTIIVIEKEDKKYLEQFINFLIICAMLKSADNISALHTIGIL